MAKQRNVHTTFWTDGFIRKINPLERYLFLYFLTNDHSNLCGVYEIALDVVSFETGLTITDLQVALLPRLEPKVVYREGWVYIKNFEKFHEQGSPKIKLGINAAKNEVPSHIWNLFEDSGKGMDTLSPSPSPLPSPLPLPSFTVRASHGPVTKKNQKNGRTSEEEKNIGEVIQWFKKINPLAETRYGWATWRTGAHQLVTAAGGVDGAKKIIDDFVAERSTGSEYLNAIDTPQQMANQYASIRQKLDKRKTGAYNPKGSGFKYSDPKKL